MSGFLLLLLFLENKMQRLLNRSTYPPFSPKQD